MGMSLNSGGHLTHGAKPTFSGKYYHIKQYEVDEETYLINYEHLETQMLNFRPRLFIAGASAYSREIDFKKLRQIVDRVNNETLIDIKKDYEVYQDKIEENGIDYINNRYKKEKCYFMVDMAHIAGLVAAGLHQSPIPYADVVTSTTHKTLRGPRGGIILTNDAEIAKKINSAVFPGCQGGPLENIIAAKAVCFGEALKPEFKEYMENVVCNTKQLAHTLKNLGVNVLTDGTDNHLLLLDLRNTNTTGAELESRLEEVGIISNKNAIPFDTEKKTVTSGLRLGAAAVTSRGLGINEMYIIANIIYKCIVGTVDEFNLIKNELISQVKNICKKYPLYSD